MNDRISWDELFIKTALLVAQRSSCIRVQVGAILVKDNKIISMGYNGVPKGQEHCCDHFKGIKDLSSEEFKQEHLEFSKTNEIHAEMNTLLYAAKEGIKIDGAHMYITVSPCRDCAKALCAAGIKKVCFYKLYDRDTKGLDFLRNNGIPCIQIYLNGKD